MKGSRKTLPKQMDLFFAGFAKHINHIGNTSIDSCSTNKFVSFFKKGNAQNFINKIGYTQKQSSDIYSRPCNYVNFLQICNFNFKHLIPKITATDAVMPAGRFVIV